MTWKTKVGALATIAALGLAAACDKGTAGPAAGEKQVAISFRNASGASASSATLPGGVEVSEQPIMFTVNGQPLTLDNLSLTLQNVRLDCANGVAGVGDNADDDSDSDQANTDTDNDTDNDDADTDSDSDGDNDTSDDVPLRMRTATVTLSQTNQLVVNGILPAGITCTSFDAVKFIARDLSFTYSYGTTTNKPVSLSLNMPINVRLNQPLTFTTNAGSITLNYDLTQLAAAIQSWINANPTKINDLSSARNEHQLLAMLKRQLRSFLRSM